MEDFALPLFALIAIVVVSVIQGFAIASGRTEEERKLRQEADRLHGTSAQMNRIKVLKQYHHDPEAYSDKSLDDQEDYLELDDMAYFYQAQDMKKRRGGK